MNTAMKNESEGYKEPFFPKTHWSHNSYTTKGFILFLTFRYSCTVLQSWRTKCASRFGRGCSQEMTRGLRPWEAELEGLLEGAGRLNRFCWFWLVVFQCFVCLLGHREMNDRRYCLCGSGRFVEQLVLHCRRSRGNAPGKAFRDGTQSEDLQKRFHPFPMGTQGGLEGGGGGHHNLLLL